MPWRRKRTENDFASEVQSHIELEADRLQAEGLSPREAQWQARKAFGNVLRSTERFHDSRRWPWLDNLQQDLTYGIRQIAKNKAFNMMAALTLALGIGSAAAIFTLVDATLIRNMPYRDGDHILHIRDVRLRGQSTGGLVGVPRFFDLQTRSKSYDALAFYYFGHPTMITASSSPSALLGASVSADFWEVIGIQPILGRAFTAKDDKPHAPLVAIISYAAWQRIFAGNPSAVNQQVMLDGKSAAIIGVLPPGLEYPSKVEVWTPAQFEPTEWIWRGEGTRFVNVVGRLKQNVSIVSAQRELSVIGERLRTEYSNSDGNWRFGSESLRDFLYGGVKPALLLLMAASGVLLLIACINVANLLLSRGTARLREVSLRRVLGASPGRILIQFVTENTLLSLLGGGIGLLAAYVLVCCLGTRLPGSLGRSAIAMNWPVAGFTFCISLLTGIVFGCVPVLQTRDLDLNTSLKQGNARVGRSAGNRIRMAFISVEVALSLVLLIGASLLGESLWNLIKLPLGFQSDQVLTFRMTLPWSMKPKLVNRFYDQLQQGIQTIPGVSAVGQVGALPTVDWHMRSSFDVDWKPRSAHGDAVNVEDRTISGGYLKAMAIPLLAGRILTEEDAEAKPPRALVNQQFAEQYFPGGSVIGRHLINSITQFEIVGVIGNVRGTGGSIAAPVGPEFYFHFDEGDTQRYFVVRSPLAADQLTSAIREKVHQLDATQAISDVATLNGRLNQAVEQPRLNMGLLGAFAAAALMLACVGIYGVVSFTVAQRSIEIGIRMALGATRAQILGLFVRRTALAALIGLATGGVAAFLLARLLQSQLYGVQPGHLPAYLLAGALIMLSTLLATCMPAARATSLNPALTMRDR